MPQASRRTGRNAWLRRCRSQSGSFGFGLTKDTKGKFVYLIQIFGMLSREHERDNDPFRLPSRDAVLRPESMLVDRDSVFVAVYSDRQRALDPLLAPQERVVRLKYGAYARK